MDQQTPPSFLLLDATEDSITLCWEKGGDGKSVQEEVQMKGADEGGAIDGADGTGGAEWATLSKTLTSGALRKKKLLPGRAYVFRRRSKQEADVAGVSSNTFPEMPSDLSPELQPNQHEGWGNWSEVSKPFRTLSEGEQQPPAPVVKLREAGALVMEWQAISGSKGYEVQMSASGREWATIAPSFGPTLLRKKGLEGSKQYRFRLRPVFLQPLGEGGGGEDGRGEGKGGGGGEWGWSPASPPASPAVLNSFLRSPEVPEDLVGKNNAVVKKTVLAGKVVAFYFSASWCGPCRKYTPQLAALYARAKAELKAFEVVFVSLDSDEASMTRYHESMPWPAVPFHHPFREDFASANDVNSVPRLIVTGRGGQELDSNAVGMTWEQLVALEAHK